MAKLSEFITLANLYFCCTLSAVTLGSVNFILNSRAEFFLGKHEWSFALLAPVRRVGAAQCLL